MTTQTEQVQGMDQACIIQFTAGYWRAKKKIPKEKLERIVENNPAAAKWLTGSQSLIDPVEIKKVGKKIGVASTYLNPSNPESPVLRYPIAGLKTIPIALIEVCDARLTEMKAEFMEAKTEFIANLNEFKEAAKNDLELDGLFNEIDYPMDLENKYYMDWRFLLMQTPDNIIKIAPDVYEREKAKFIEVMEQVRVESVDALRATFGDMVSNICDRFANGTKDGKKKIFKNSTVNNFYDFFEQFKQRNIFQDAELDELVNKAQNILKGREADEIRDSDSMKKLIRKNMLPLEKQLKKLTEKPRRKLDID
jgi:hypothetical protein